MWVKARGIHSLRRWWWFVFGQISCFTKHSPLCLDQIELDGPIWTIAWRHADTSFYDNWLIWSFLRTVFHTKTINVDNNWKHVTDFIISLIQTFVFCFRFSYSLNHNRRKIIHFRANFREWRINTSDPNKSYFVCF